MNRRRCLQAAGAPLLLLGPARAGERAGPPPLIDGSGRPLPPLPGAVPDDPGARTAAGRYACGAQALALERQLGAALVHLTVDGRPEAAPEAVRRTLARRGLPASAPILVDGPDVRAAARAADALHEAGHPRVWLVTR